MAMVTPSLALEKQRWAIPGHKLLGDDSRQQHPLELLDKQQGSGCILPGTQQLSQHGHSQLPACSSHHRNPQHHSTAISLKASPGRRWARPRTWHRFKTQSLLSLQISVCAPLLCPSVPGQNRRASSQLDAHVDTLLPWSV